VLVGQPVVHFEIIGRNPDKLRSYFGDLFGWQFDTSSRSPKRCRSRRATLR